MNQGLGITLAVLALLTGNVSADIYKIVDEHGNITYTDQAPPDGSAPMKLPELTVIETDYDDEIAAAAEAAADEEEPGELTVRDLRRMYRDFRIIQPAPEETFWGTANSVVISWGSDTPLESGLKVRVHVDGAQQAESQGTSMAITLDRGEHTVYAELLDSRGRRLVTTPTVTFFIKQQAVGFNRPNPAPVSGH